MNSGARALWSGCIAFVVATATILLFDRETGRTEAMTIGGLTGGAVALSVYSSSRDRAGRGFVEP